MHCPAACRERPLRHAPTASSACLLVLGLALAWLGPGCASGPRRYEDLQPELRKSTVVSLGEVGPRPPRGSSFGWLPSSRVMPGPQLDEAVTERLLREALQAALVDVGYVPATGEDPSMRIGYVAALESSLDDEQIVRLFGLSPGMVRPDSHESYEKGTVVVLVVDERSGRTIWRGVIQALADPSLPEDVRVQRLRAGARSLIDRFASGA